MDLNLILVIDDFTTNPVLHTIKKELFSDKKSFTEYILKLKINKNDKLDCLINGEFIDVQKDEFSLENGNVVKIIKSVEEKKESKEIAIDDGMIKQIMKRQMDIMKNGSFEVLNKIVNITDFIEITEDIQKDPIAHSIALSINFIETLFGVKENVKAVLIRYPVLIPAALNTLNKVYQYIKTSPQTSTTNLKPEDDYSVRYYSLDSVDNFYNPDTGNDDDDDDEDDDDNNEFDYGDDEYESSELSNNRGGRGDEQNRQQQHLDNRISGTGSSRNISRHDLRRAIANITRTQSNTTSNSRSIRPGNSNRRRLSLNQVQSAIRSVLASQTNPGANTEPMDVDANSGSVDPQINNPISTASSTSASSVSDNDFELKVRAMIDMGFSDETAVRVSLEAAGGNIEAAIDFYYGSL